MKLMYDKDIEADTDCRHFAGDIFKCILLNKNLWISFMISLKSVPEAPSNNIPTLVQIMVWCRPSDKPVSEPIVVILLTHICVTQPQWVNIVSPAVWYIKPTWDWNGAEKWNLRMCVGKLSKPYTESSSKTTRRNEILNSYCLCLSISTFWYEHLFFRCLRLSACMSLRPLSITSCPRENPSPVEAGISKYWSEVQKTLLRSLLFSFFFLLVIALLFYSFSSID